MADTTPPHTISRSSKSSTHRKAWLDRIGAGTRLAVRCSSLCTSLSSILLIALLLLTPIVSAQISTDNPGSGSFVMPWAFDAAVGNNFTQPACKKWFSGFIEEIRPCHAVSLMLQTSVSFFDATKSLVSITRALDTSCHVDYDTCSTMMSTFASELQRSDTCQQDYKLQNPTLTQAYAGLLAYQPLFGATCLKDTSPTSTGGSTTEGGSGTVSVAPMVSNPPFADGGTLGGNTRRQASSSGSGSYCYANAVTNTTSPSASYFYYLPLGISLPGGNIPTCDQCLKSVMQTFSSYASNTSQPLSETYASAASDVNLFCGPTFVNQNIASGAEAMARPWSVGLWSLAAVVAYYLAI